MHDLYHHRIGHSLRPWLRLAAPLKPKPKGPTVADISTASPKMCHTAVIPTVVVHKTMQE